MNKKIAQSKLGFTLMEIAVTIGIFSIILVIAFGFYFSLMRMQTEARVRQELASKARFITELVQNHLHQSQLDYDSIGANLQDTLLLINKNTLESVKIWEDVALDVIKFRVGVTDYNLTQSADVAVEKLKFYITPYPNDALLQKKVTVFLHLKDAKSPDMEIKVQTTFSLRGI